MNVKNVEEILKFGTLTSFNLPSEQKKKSVTIFALKDENIYSSYPHQLLAVDMFLHFS